MLKTCKAHKMRLGNYGLIRARLSDRALQPHKLMTTISAYSLPRLFVGNIPLFVRTGKALLKRSAGF